MSHQPFETWMLDEPRLSAEQDALLKAHLEECGACRNLKEGWQAAQASLKAPVMARPAAGFSRRFNGSLAGRRRLEAQRRQLRILIAVLAVSAALAAGLLAWAVFSAASPVDLLVRATDAVTRAVGWWNRAQQVLFSALQQPVVLVIWILATSGVSLMAVAWLFTLWRISFQGARNS